MGDLLKKLFTSAFFMDAGFFLIVAAIPYKILDLGGGPLELGTVPVLSSTTYIIMARLIGGWSDRFDRVRLGRYGGLALIAFAALAFSTESIGSLALVMPIMGLGAALYWPNIQSMLGDVSADGAALERNTGRFNVAWSAGKSLGFLSAGFLLAHYDFRTTFLTAIGLIALSFLLLPRKETESASELVAAEREDETGRQVFRRMAWLANFAAFGASAVLVNHLPKWFETRGWDESDFGLYLGTIYICQTIAFLLLSGTVRFTYSFLRLALPQVLALLAVGLLPAIASYGIVLATAPLVGVCLGVTYAASLYYSLHTSTGRGRNAGIHESLIGAAVMMLPFLGGVLARIAGNLALPYLVAALVMAVTLVIQFFWWRRSQA